MISLAPYFLLIIFASGDVKIVQDLNRDSCLAARDVIRAFSAAAMPPEKQVAFAQCFNTLQPLEAP